MKNLDIDYMYYRFGPVIHWCFYGYLGLDNRFWYV